MENFQGDTEPVPPGAPSSFPDYVSIPFEPLHGKLFKMVFKLILDKGLFFNGDRQRHESPFQYRNPEQRQQEINFTLQRFETSQESVYDLLEKVIRFSPHLSHPFYLSGKTTAYVAITS